MEDFESTSYVFSNNATYPQMPLWESIVSVTFTIPIICFTVAGNIFVIIAIFIHKPLRCAQNYLIVSLAVTDLLVGLLMFPVGVLEILDLRWKLGTHICNILVTCIGTCTAASILNLCAIALDRYWAVADPIAYAYKRTMKRMVTIITLVWIISPMICFLPLLGWVELPELTGHTSCTYPDEKSFVLCTTLMFFFSPLFLLSFVYFRIYQTIRQRLNARAPGNIIKMSRLPNRPTNSLPEQCLENKSRETSPERIKHSESLGKEVETETSLKQKCSKRSSLQVPSVANSSNLTLETSPITSSFQNTSQISNSTQQPTQDNFVTNFFAEKQRILLTREQRIIKTLTIIVGAFFFCMVPFFVWYNINAFCPNCMKPHPKLQNFIVWLTYINSTLNPIIYTVFNKDFREAFKKILKC